MTIKTERGARVKSNIDFAVNILHRAAESSREDGDTRGNEAYIVERFMSEMGWNIARKGAQGAAMDWVQGLAINVPFYDLEILELCEAQGVRVKAKTLKGQESADILTVERYWRALAFQVVKMVERKQAYTRDF